MEGRGGYQNKIVTKNKSNTCEELTKHSHFGINNNIQFNYKTTRSTHCHLTNHIIILTTEEKKIDFHFHFVFFLNTWKAQNIFSFFLFL